MAQIVRYTVPRDNRLWPGPGEIVVGGVDGTPSKSPHRLDAFAHGVRPTESATNNADRLTDLLTLAASNGRPATIDLPLGTMGFDGATLNVPVSVSLAGKGSTPDATATYLTDLSFTVGASGTWAHGNRLTDFRLKTPPGIGIHWLSRFGELAWMDNIAVVDAVDDSFRLADGGTPTHIGSLNSVRSGGAALRIVGAKNVTLIDHLSGDANADGLLVIAQSDVSGTALVRVHALKSETNAPIVQIVDSPRLHVSIGILTAADAVGSLGGTDPMILQTGSDTPATVSIEAVAATNPGEYAAGYVDQTSGHTVSVADLTAFRVTTRPTLWTPPTGETQIAPQPVLTGAVGTSETALYHGLPYTPAIITLQAGSDATVWSSAPPDATNLYLTASAATTATVTLGRATPRTAGVLTVHDTFTATDNTQITAHTPDTGAGPWAQTAFVPIVGNRLTPASGGRGAYIASGATDVALRATCNFGQHVGTRQIGFFLRLVDASNYWRILFVQPDSLNCYALLTKRVAGVDTNVGGTPNIGVLAQNSDFQADAILRGTNLEVRINGASKARFTLTSDFASATQHGLYVGSFGTNTTAPSFDDFSLWTL